MTTETIILDASFGHAEMKPTEVKKTGAAGIILYAGCNDTRKNATKAEVQALLAAGIQVGLVIENVNTDARGGASVGDAQGRAIVAGAKAVDYDWQNCVLFGGYDADSHPADWPHLLAYMEAFAKHVPVPGYYGDSDSIDYLHARHPDWIYWQSDSRSFSPLNPSSNTHILQMFNDPRAHGLPVDVNVLYRSHLRLMGDKMQLDPHDPVILDLKKQIAANQKQINGWFWVVVHGDPNHPNSQDAEGVLLRSVEAALAKLQVPNVDPSALVAAIAEHIKLATQ
jgi:hypothetical protein